MTQEQKPLINLSVHESSDPSVISPNSDVEPSSNLNDLNDASHDFENADAPIPEPSDAALDDHIVDRQTTIANLSAG